jgi:hypothetical protein
MVNRLHHCCGISWPQLLLEKESILIALKKKRFHATSHFEFWIAGVLKCINQMQFSRISFNFQEYVYNRLQFRWYFLFTFFAFLRFWCTVWNVNNIYNWNKISTIHDRSFLCLFLATDGTSPLFKDLYTLPCYVSKVSLRSRW